MFINADSELKLKFISVSLCVDSNLTALHSANTAEMWMLIIKAFNEWCSLLYFWLFSVGQATPQWVRIYCCFVFWEKTVAWEKIPKSAVSAPHPAPLTNSGATGGLQVFEGGLHACNGGQTRSLPAAENVQTRFILKTGWRVKLLLRVLNSAYFVWRCRP